MTTSTPPHATTYAQLLDRIIADGIAEVREAYAEPKDHHKRDGAIEGFEACRGKTPAELVELFRAAEDRAQQHMRAKHDGSPSDRQDHVKLRYTALQIEWVCNVVSVGLANSGQAPLFAHLPTARAAMKYAEIVGVRGEGVGA